MNIVIGPLETFYIVGALVGLTIAIVAYPTLKYGTKDDDESSPRKSHKLVKSR